MTSAMQENEKEQGQFGQVILYQAADGSSGIDVFLKDETVWLTLNQMAELFGRDNSVISRHLRNIFQTGELLREATVAKNATVQSEGGRQVTRHMSPPARGRGLKPVFGKVFIDSETVAPRAEAQSQARR